MFPHQMFPTSNFLWGFIARHRASEANRVPVAQVAPETSVSQSVASAPQVRQTRRALRQMNVTSVNGQAAFVDSKSHSQDRSLPRAVVVHAQRPREDHKNVQAGVSSPTPVSEDAAIRQTITQSCGPTFMALLKSIVEKAIVPVGKLRVNDPGTPPAREEILIKSIRDALADLPKGTFSSLVPAETQRYIQALIRRENLREEAAYARAHDVVFKVGLKSVAANLGSELGRGSSGDFKKNQHALAESLCVEAARLMRHLASKEPVKLSESAVKQEGKQNAGISDAMIQAMFVRARLQPSVQALATGN